MSKLNWEEFQENCGHRLYDEAGFYECTINEDEKGNYRCCSFEKDCPLLNKRRK